MKKFIVQLLKRYIVTFVCFAVAAALLFIWLVLSGSHFKTSTITMSTANQSQPFFIDACTLALPDQLHAVGINIKPLHEKTAISRNFIDFKQGGIIETNSSDPSSGCAYTISDGIRLRISVYQPMYSNVSHVNNRLLKEFNKEESINSIEIYKQNIRVDDNLFKTVSNEGDEDFILKSGDNLVVINFQYDAPKYMRQSVKHLVVDNFARLLKEPQVVSSVQYEGFPKDIKLLVPCNLLDHRTLVNFFSTQVSAHASESLSSIARNEDIFANDSYILRTCTRSKVSDKPADKVELETRQYDTDQNASAYLQSQVSSNEVAISIDGREYVAYYHSPRKYHGYGYMIMQRDSVVLTTSCPMDQGVPSKDECINKLTPLIKAVVHNLHQEI